MVIVWWSQLPFVFGVVFWCLFDGVFLSIWFLSGGSVPSRNNRPGTVLQSMFRI